jgi:N-acetylgalactosamine kinase
VSTAADDRTTALLGAVSGEGDAVLARAPGRVNLIGEHTDYNGLPVLPFAIEPDVMVAARPRTDGTIDAMNQDSRFPPRRFRPVRPLPPFPAGDWGNYLKASTDALLRDGVRLGGASLCIDGRIAPAAGVSSSSALVVATALAQLTLAEAAFDRVALAETLARGEQYVGTLSGGMDQAAILLGRPGHAVRLDFFPLRARAVAVPAAVAFVVAHTLEQAAKSGAARAQYNQRVVECRAATAVLGRRLGRPLRRLGELPDPAAVLDALDHLLPDGPVSRAELTTGFGIPAVEVERLVPPDVTVADADRLVLRRRVRHVLTEAARVEAAERALLAGDVAELGALLDASHASGAADYGTSTPAADEVVRIARAGGARGARLMGAGFGGAALVLIERERTAQVLAALDGHFYAPRHAGSDSRFVVSPASGATVARVDCHGGVC